MAAGPIDPNIARNYRETAEALRNDESRFIGKELNAEGQLVNPRRGVLDSLRLRLCTSNHRAREALINQFVKQYKANVEVMLPAAARTTKEDLSDKDRLLARIERALTPIASAARASAPAALAASESSPKAEAEAKSKARVELEDDLQQQQERQQARSERAKAAAAARPSPPPPAPAVTPPQAAKAEASFTGYKNLPRGIGGIDGMIADRLDPHTRGAIAATERSARVPSEPAYHEACALFAFCGDVPGVKEHLDKLSDDKKAIIALLKEGKYEELNARQKKTLIEMAGEVQKIIGNQDRSAITRLSADFPIRAMPANFAALFPNLKFLKFTADKLYKGVDLPQLKELEVEGMEGADFNLIRANNLEKLVVKKGLKEMPDLTGCPLLADVRILGCELTRVDSARLPQSVRVLTLSDNEHLSHVRLELPNLRYLHIDSSPRKKAAADIELRTPELRRFTNNEARLAEIPHTLFGCKKLEVLNLNGTQIRHLPMEMTELAQLKRIQLDMTPIDHFPAVLGLMPELGVIGISVDAEITLPAWLEEFPPNLMTVILSRGPRTYSR